MAMTITVSAVSDTDPCPRVDINVSGVSGADSITVERHVGDTLTNVRGAKNETVSTGFLVTDYEIPFTTNASYRATSYSGANVVETVESSVVSVNSPTPTRWDTIYLQDPLKPESVISVMVEQSSLASWTLKRDLDLLNVRASSLPIASGGVLSGRTDVPVTLICESDSHRDSLLAFFAEATVFLVRTIDPLPMPRGGYFSVEQIGVAPELGDLSRDPSGRWSYLAMSLQEVRAPSADVVVPVFTWRDVVDNYTSWADLIATKATWADVIRDPRP